MLPPGEHVNMPGRIGHGLWPHPPLRLSEVLAHLTRLLHEHRWFPRELRHHREGEPVQEGGRIERQGPDRYVYRGVRACPVRPNVVADSVACGFSSAEDAARCYLQWDLHLPGDVDGWKVIE
jgi:hypothetical protein